MNSYAAPLDWYEPDPIPDSPADYGWVHEDDLPDLDFCADLVRDMVRGWLTNKEIGDALEELAFQLEVPYELPASTERSANP